jgi:hypothetical protein
MLDGAVAPSGRAYTSARTPARLPSNRPPPTPEEVHQRVHDRVFKYLYKQPGFLHPFEHHTKEIYRKVSSHRSGIAAERSFATLQSRSTSPSTQRHSNRKMMIPWLRFDMKQNAR